MVDAVAGRAEVYVDGGVRNGVDVLKALALGARAVMVGRPVVWGLARRRRGRAPRAVLAQLTVELGRAMALCGARRSRDRRDLHGRPRSGDRRSTACLTGVA